MKLKLYNSPKVRLGKGRINGVTYSPDGNRRAVASSIGILICDAHTGEELKLLSGHASEVLSVAYSPDGLTLASGSEDNTARLWDAQSGQHKLTLEGHEDAVTSVVFSPNGGTLASGSKDTTIRLWDTKSAYHKSTLEGHGGGVTSVVFNPKGNRLASGGGDRTVRLWESEIRFGQNRCITTLQKQDARVTSVVFSPDGHLFASGSAEGPICLWKLSNIERPISLSGHTETVHAIVFSPDGRTLASGSADNTIHVWDARGGQHFATLKGHTNGVFSVEFSPDGGMLISESYDSTIRFWDVKTGKNETTLRGGHTDCVKSLAFAPNGQMLASVNSDKDADGLSRKDRAASVSRRRTDDELSRENSAATVHLWDVGTGIPKAMVSSDVESVVISPNGQTLVGVREEKEDDSSRFSQKIGTARFGLWDVGTGTSKATVPSDVESVVISPNGQILVDVRKNKGIRSDRSRGNFVSAHLWDVETGIPNALLTEEIVNVKTVNVRLIVFSPDSQTLASLSEDARVGREHYSTDKSAVNLRLWKVETGKEPTLCLTEEVPDVTSIVFSPDSQTLATVDKDISANSYHYSSRHRSVNVRLWDVGSGKSKPLFMEDEANVSPVNVTSIVFSPDSRTLATVDKDMSEGIYGRAAISRSVSIRLWDGKTGAPKASFVREDTSDVKSIVFTSNSQTLASVHRDNTISLWDVETGQHKSTLAEEMANVNTIFCSPSGGTLISLSGSESSGSPYDVDKNRDEKISFWDVETGERKSTLAEEMASVKLNVLSPDRTRLAGVGLDGRIRVWDVETGQHKSTFEGHIGQVTFIVFSADGSTLASGSEDGTVLLWDLTE